MMLDYEKRQIVARCAIKDCKWNEDCFKCPMFFPPDPVTTTKFWIFHHRKEGSPFKGGINYWSSKITDLKTFKHLKNGHGLALCINVFGLQFCIGYYWGVNFNKRLWCKRKKKG